MSILTEKEFLLINDIVREIHAAGSVKEMGRIFLTLIRKLIPYHSASFIVTTPQNPMYINAADDIFIDVSIEQVKEYNKYIAFDFTNPAFNYPKSTSFRDSDMISEEERENTEFYNKWMKNNNIRYSGGIVVKTPECNVISSTIYRSKFNGSFTEREMMILDMFLGHIEDIAAKFLDSPAIEKKLPEEYTDDKRYNTLSNREKEIFPYILERYSNEEISNKFCISISTVKKHRHSIFKKFDVASRQELIDSLSDTK